jgi:hypothetical protein
MDLSALKLPETSSGPAKKLEEIPVKRPRKPWLQLQKSRKIVLGRTKNLAKTYLANSQRSLKKRQKNPGKSWEKSS